MDPDQVQQLQPAVAAGIGVGFIVVYLGLWVFIAFCMAKIGEKLGQPFTTGLIMSLIPIANIIFMLQLAAKPLWWVILLFIPIVNLVIIVMIWMAIAEKRGRPAWWGVLMMIPIANVVVLLALAFGK